MPNVYTDPSAGGNVPDWQEDANSPFTMTNVSSKQFTLASDWDRVMLIPVADNLGPNQIQVNGDTGTNYDYVSLDGTQASGASQWFPNRTRHWDAVTLMANHNWPSIGISASTGTDKLDTTISGRNKNVDPPINTITLSDDGGTNRSVTIEVYGLNVG